MKLYIQVIYKDFNESGDVGNRMFFVGEGQYTMTLLTGFLVCQWRYGYQTLSR